MNRLTKDMLRTCLEMLDAGVAEFYIDRILKRTYPNGSPINTYRKDALNHLKSVIKHLSDTTGVEFVPLTAYYFQNYFGEDPPKSRKEARKCVPGTIPGTGRAVGFQVSIKGVLTEVLRKHHQKASWRYTKSELNTSINTCKQIGVNPPAIPQVQSTVQQIEAITKQIPWK